MDVLGPKISRFANTQNQVKRSDLASNHKVYKEIEQLSRTIFAPPKEGSQIETKWFFERAKGQYTDELSLKQSAKTKKEFEKEFPRLQKLISQTCAGFGALGINRSKM